VSDRQSYLDIKFNHATMTFIGIIDKILTRYSNKGLTMTVRQLHYRLVTEGVMPNTKKQYKKLVKVVTDARMAGLLSWDAIEDRHRRWERRQHWESGQQYIDAVANSYHMDMWEGQKFRPFVLIEKDALSGVFSSTCHNLDVPLLSCKGYLSASSSRDFATIDMRYSIADGQTPIVFHFGDHDPSGIDMTRDLQERLAIFLEIEEPQIKRMALSLEQVKRWNLAPNPTNPKDARFASYVRRYGRKCWELDAIEPEDLQSMCKRAIERLIDWDVWERRQKQIAAIEKRIRRFAKKFKG
jgi:hypothetical protein